MKTGSLLQRLLGKAVVSCKRENVSSDLQPTEKPGAGEGYNPSFRKAEAGRFPGSLVS